MAKERNKEVSITHLQQVLDKSNGLSISQRKFFQKLINGAKKFNGKVTDREYEQFQRMKQGDFKYSTKNENQNPVDTIILDVPLFIRLLEYAREDAKDDMDLHNVAQKAIELSSSGQTLNMNQYNNLINTNSITEMEKSNKTKVTKVKSLKESSMDEMARSAGTGNAIKITAAGEDKLREAKTSGNVPQGMKQSDLGGLIWLFKNKGKRVQKVDLANELGKPQPAVNGMFNRLIEMGLAEIEGYTTAQKEKTPKAGGVNVADLLGDLDL